METETILWCLLIGGIVSAILIFSALKFPFHIGRVIPPSIISIIHAPIIWVGYFFLLHSHIPLFQILGFQLVVIGGVLDAVDGMVARGVDKLIALQILPKELVDAALEEGKEEGTGWSEFYRIFHPAVEREIEKGNTHVTIHGIRIAIRPPESRLKQLFYPGGTQMGKHIDPLFDKAGMLPLFFDISWKLCFTNLQSSFSGLLLLTCATILYLIIAIDLMGTWIRFFRSYWFKSAKATKVGKRKVHVQWAWLLLFQFFGQGWATDESPAGMLFLTAFALIILAMGIASIVSKFKSD